MLVSRLLCAAAATVAAASLGACRDVTAACGPSSKPAMIVSAYDANPASTVHDVTIVYDRHGDDSLTVLRDLATAVHVPLGNRPGIYDVRLMAPGYADWLLTNDQIRANGCDPATTTMQVFMQKLP